MRAARLRCSVPCEPPRGADAFREFSYWPDGPTSRAINAVLDRSPRPVKKAGDGVILRGWAFRRAATEPKTSRSMAGRSSRGAGVARVIAPRMLDAANN